MNLTIRLTRDLYEEMETDLRRPHPYAAERVGFAMGKIGNQSGDDVLVLLSQYRPVEDTHYVNTWEAGARIDSDAIRSAMQDILDLRCGAFHVHMHAHRGRPRFSPTDERGIPSVVQGLRAAGPTQAHGMFLLSKNKAIARAWLPGQEDPVVASKITVVGYPITTFYPLWRIADER